MKRIALSTLLIAVLAACSSTPMKEAAPVKVEDKSPKAAAPAPTAPQAAPATQASAGETNPLKDPKNILSKRSVYFDLDEYVVRDEFKPMVQAHARYLTQNASAHMTVQGNTDERGSREYNLALGQRRADETGSLQRGMLAKKFLLSLGRLICLYAAGRLGQFGSDERRDRLIAVLRAVQFLKDAALGRFVELGIDPCLVSAEAVGRRDLAVRIEQRISRSRCRDGPTGIDALQEEIRAPALWQTEFRLVSTGKAGESQCVERSKLGRGTGIVAGNMLELL